MQSEPLATKGVRPQLLVLNRALTRKQLGLLAVVVLALLLARWNDGLWHWNLEDLAVYRRAGGALVKHHRLYATKNNQLPFTYPPFAAVPFAAAHAIGSVAAGVVLTCISAASLAVIVRISCDHQHMLVAVAPLTLILLAAEPVIRTLRLGQINLVLIALVMLDCLVAPARVRGLLTGVVAGVKLTPAVFVLYFMLRRDWRAVGRSALGLGISIGLSSMLAPADTWKFWTTMFYNPDHVGGIAYVDNQSLVGVLVRLTHNEHPAVAMTGCVQLAALGLAMCAAQRQLTAGDGLAALTCVGIGGLLVSPISWSHHWIWLLPALVIMLQRGLYAAAGLVGVVTYVAPHWFTPAGGLKEFHQSWCQQLLCATMAAAGILALLILGRSHDRATLDRATGAPH